MSEFKREERYIVVKLKRIDGDTAEALRDFLDGWQVPTEECVVVEHDWPNYEATWKAIQQIEEGTYDPDELDNLRKANTDCVAWENACKADLDRALARVAELERVMDIIQNIAKFPPVDKVILKYAEDAIRQQGGELESGS